MDRKSIIVLSVCFVLFVLWAQLTPRFYPPKLISRTNTIASATNVAASPNTATSLEAANQAPWIAPKSGAPEELVVVANDLARYTFTSHGGGLKLVELLKYPESVSKASKASTVARRVATLNAQAQQPVLSLQGSETLVGDGIYKLGNFSGTWTDGTNGARAVSGIRAEKLLTNGLFVVKEFELGSNYLVNVRVRFENRAAQALMLPPQQWVSGTATPLDAQDDEALVGLGNMMGRQFQVSPLRIPPSELYLVESQEASTEFRLLQGLAPENIRSRYALLVQLNLGLSTDLMELTDFRAAAFYPGSAAAAISKAMRKH